nr:MAG TPA: Protein of unknown function (DUF515) [Caudoviricetes sp.]
MRTPTGTPCSVTPSLTDSTERTPSHRSVRRGSLHEKRKKQVTLLVFTLTICLLVIVWTNFND